MENNKIGVEYKKSVFTKSEPIVETFNFLKYNEDVRNYRNTEDNNIKKAKTILERETVKENTIQTLILNAIKNNNGK